jgi:hypothetical protein
MCLLNFDGTNIKKTTIHVLDNMTTGRLEGVKSYFDGLSDSNKVCTTMQRSSFENNHSKVQKGGSYFFKDRVVSVGLPSLIKYEYIKGSFRKYIFARMSPPYRQNDGSVSFL